MSPRRAPTAMRIPISLVRSDTDTSMMFITPIPPTTSEMIAMVEISSVSVAEVDWMVSRIVSVFIKKKSAVPPCSRVTSSVMSVSACAMSKSSATRIAIELRCA